VFDFEWRQFVNVSSWLAAAATGFDGAARPTVTGFVVGAMAPHCKPGF
jgi:hypothetical protein